MPIGKGKDPPKQPIEAKQTGDNRLFKIRLPKETRPIRDVIPPIVRQGSKQYTCIRFDEHGQYFVDEFVERGHMLGAVVENRRFMTHVSCPKFHFEVALAVCHRYCSFPCDLHSRTIKEHGWFHDSTTEIDKYGLIAEKRRQATVAKKRENG